MKILYIVHQFFPEYYTGTEKFIYNLAKMMQTLGNKVKVVCYSSYDDSNYKEISNNIMIREYVYNGIPVTAFKIKNEPIDFHYSLSNNIFGEIADDLIRKENPDIVHVGHSMRMNEFVKSSYKLGIPYVVNITDFFTICPKYILIDSQNDLCLGPCKGEMCYKKCKELSRKMVFNRLNEGYNLLKNSNQIIAPSKFVANIVQNEIDDISIKVIPHGISYKYINKNKKTYKNNDKIVLGYAGSLSKHKGVHVLIDALKKIINNDIELKIYGSGVDSNYVNYVENSALNDNRIKFCGVFNQTEIGNVLNQIDVLVIPSLCYESYSLIFHEAIASNLPTIVSNIGSLYDVIDNEQNGFYYQVGNINSLKNTINYIVDNPSILNNIKNNISKMIVPTIEQEAYAYEKIYRMYV